ncbi:hypothetical protein [Desulfobacter sp. UBA2225]|uniref:hypothetical protein n=1 Tax=Desulfobacter sp. UBA2225 TaxID=1961413 RepID=UPI00257F9943|nr:hypothetical protein [Desulfobacter sp. UBA2225]
MDFLLSVVSDETQDPKLRTMAAKYALPYVKAKKSGGEALGKKEEKQEKAKQAQTGRFSASKPPLKIIR